MDPAYYIDNVIFWSWCNIHNTNVGMLIKMGIEIIEEDKFKEVIKMDDYEIVTGCIVGIFMTVSFQIGTIMTIAIQNYF